MRSSNFGVVLFVLLAVAPTVEGGFIETIEINPPVPKDSTPITVEVGGSTPSIPSAVISSEFTRDGSDLLLEIRLALGPFTAIGEWSHTHEIGLLPSGDYDLTITVITLVNFEDVPFSRGTTFAVVPEPSSLGLLAAAGATLLIRRRKPSNGKVLA
jgi:hypothetical protein